MPSISNYLSLLERLQSRFLVVDPYRCVTVRNRNVTCDRCAYACTTGCISQGEDGIQVDNSKCIGCGTCACSCPTGAIEPRQPDDRTLARQIGKAVERASGIAVMACEKMLVAARGRIDPETVVSVSCIGRVDESLIVLLKAAGAKKIRLVTGDCGNCEHARGCEVAHDVVTTANRLLEAWSAGDCASISSKFPICCRLEQGGAAYDRERREFFQSVRDEAKDAVHDTVDYGIDAFFGKGKSGQHYQHVGADGTMEHKAPRRRELLLDALKSLGEPEDVLMETRLWGHVIIDANICDGCRMCAVFCPTGALGKLIRDGADCGLVHSPGMCVKCRTCETVCPHGALSLSNEVFAVDLHAGVVETFPMEDVVSAKSAPNAIRNAMSTLIDSPYLVG